MPRGRPKIDNPKSKGIRVRLTEEDKEKLDYLENYLNMNKSEIIRNLIDEYHKMVKENKNEKI